MTVPVEPDGLVVEALDAAGAAAGFALGSVFVFFGFSAFGGILKDGWGGDLAESKKVWLDKN